ncbi:MAG: right-handed parallel beta-helix repeat-containing protein [Candidatus Eisenbacteria bacterium]
MISCRLHPILAGFAATAFVALPAFAEVTLSWAPDAQVDDITPMAGTTAPLFITATDFYPAADVDYELHFATEEGSDGCVTVRRCEDGTDIPCFRPQSFDTVAGEGVITGLSGFDRVLENRRAQLLIEFPEECGTFPVRFYLAGVTVTMPDGRVEEIYAGREVTVWGGGDAEFPPIVHEAFHAGRSGGSDVVIARVEFVDPGTVFRLWGTESGFHPSTDVEFYPPNHVRVRFATTLNRDEPQFLVATNQSGRSSRYRIPIRGPWQATHVVDPTGGGDFLTIQEAIDAAASGDRVLVAPGHYRGLITVDKSVRLESTQGPDVTVLDGEMQGSTVTFPPGVRGPASIVGFEVRNGGEIWGGDNLTALANSSELVGGGIRVESGAGVFVGGNRLVNNGANRMAHLGGGSGIGTDGLLFAVDNELQESRYAALGGGVYVGPGGDAILLDNAFLKNRAVVAGGAIAVYYQAHAVIEGNVFDGNSSQRDGGAVWFHADARGSVRNNTFSRNSAGIPWSGGEFYWQDPPYGGGGVFLDHDVRLDGVLEGEPLRLECRLYRRSPYVPEPFD